MGTFAAAGGNAWRALPWSTPSCRWSTLLVTGSATKYSGEPLPLPMRTSAGFFEIGLSGKMRIHTRPPRLMWRVIARRAASIWRAVRRPRPIAFKPYSPKDTLAPRVATPLLRPFCSLRYFLLAGCSISHSRFARGGLALHLGRRRRRLLALAQRLALEDEDLHADRAVSGLRLGKSVLDLGAQRMQRHATLAIPFGARDLGAVQAARACDLDALGPQAHGVLHGALHGAAEHHAFLQLPGDRIGDELRIQFGLADLLDVHVHRHAHEALQRVAKALDVLALLADHHARTRRVDRDARVLRRTLDDDLAHGGVRELLLEVLADLDVLGEHPREVLGVRVPLRAPVSIHREAEAGRVDLLSHD